MDYKTRTGPIRTISHHATMKVIAMITATASSVTTTAKSSAIVARIVQIDFPLAPAKTCAIQRNVPASELLANATQIAVTAVVTNSSMKLRLCATI